MKLNAESDAGLPVRTVILVAEVASALNSSGDPNVGVTTIAGALKKTPEATVIV
jgi:hypothetical protein